MQAMPIAVSGRRRNRLVATVLAGLLAAFGARDTLSFLAAPSMDRPLPRLGSGAPLVDIQETPSAVSPGTSAPAVGGFSALALLSVAVSGLSLRRGCLRTRAVRQVRHFFGGKGDAKAEEPAEEELSEAVVAKCEKLRQEIEDLKALAEEKQAAHERLTMEVNNFRTRTKKELAAARGKAAIPVIKELLPIADEFELAKQNLKIEGDGEQAICDRFNGLFDNMMASWKKLGVEKLEAVGEDFNPEFHEAVSMIPSEEYKADVVCNELRGGWALKPVGSDEPQILRPSLVCVSSGPGPA